MRINYSPTFRISVALVTITICAGLSAYFFGLIPDESKAELNARAKIAETLAVQLTSAASRDDVEAVQETIDSLKNRNSDVLSVAMRKSDGNILIGSEDHSTYWEGSSDSGSTPTHVKVPLRNGEDHWGQVEIAFKPLMDGKTYFGMPSSVVNFFVFLGAVGFLGYFFLLRRALKELDPTKVIPKRVHAAFDTLEEGVVILDEKENILLANSAFCKIIGENNYSLFGKKMDSLSWRQWTDKNSVKEFPWRLALDGNKTPKGVNIGLRTATNDTRSFMVNASCIANDKDKVSGAIVTFNDVTPLERKNEDLIQAVQKLKTTELEINRQNRELTYLASHDPLTGCLNRRAFFKNFDEVHEKAKAEGKNLCCMMVDLDHFKSVNDRFGHSVGDDVIKGAAKVLSFESGNRTVVGRYGGEEFCLSMLDMTIEECKSFAEEIREKIISESPTWLPVNENLTASIGLAMFENDSASVNDVVDLADKALYAAKETGRNKTLLWQEIKGTDLADAKSADTSDTDQTEQNSYRADAKSAVNNQPANQATVEYQPQQRFIDRLSRSITKADRDDNVVAVLLVSLNSNEMVSEVYGHSAAEKAGKAMYSKIEEVLRRTDTVSLLGESGTQPTLSQLPNDKVAIEISDIENVDSVLWIVKRVSHTLQEKLLIDGKEIYLNCTMGISVYPNDAHDADSLIRNASAAERSARESDGKHSYMYFSNEMNDNTRTQLAVEAAIHKAMENNEFCVYYQPIVDVKNLKLAGVEALLRSTNSVLKDKPIEYVVSVAEKIGVMPQLGFWIMDNAIQQMTTWHSEGVLIPKVSVNVSAAQFYEMENVEYIINLISGMDMPNHCLQVEITETSVMRDIEAAGAALKRLQQLGVQIALDDFGAGQCSLTYLQKFRPDILKIDRSFVENIGSSNADETVVAVCSALSNRMGMKLVAEGVETETQLERIRELECHEAQGYLFGKPMDAKSMREWSKLFAESETHQGTHEPQLKKSA